MRTLKMVNNTTAPLTANAGCFTRKVQPGEIIDVYPEWERALVACGLDVAVEKAAPKAKAAPKRRTTKAAE